MRREDEILIQTVETVRTEWLRRSHAPEMVTDIPTMLTVQATR